MLPFIIMKGSGVGEIILGSGVVKAIQDSARLMVKIAREAGLPQ